MDTYHTTGKRIELHFLPISGLSGQHFFNLVSPSISQENLHRAFSEQEHVGKIKFLSKFSAPDTFVLEASTCIILVIHLKAAVFFHYSSIHCFNPKFAINYAKPSVCKFKIKEGL